MLESQKDTLEYIESAMSTLTSDDDFGDEQKAQVITHLWRAYRSAQYATFGDDMYEVEK